MSSGLPTIAVVMPAFNASAYLPAALDSLWTQSFSDFEVIAVDDGSTDGTAEQLRSIAAREPRLRVVCGSHGGVTAALNRGLAEARSPFIARMDADDVCHPRRFEMQLAFLEANPEVVAVGAACTLIDEAGDRLTEHPYPLTHEEILDRLLAGRSGLSHPAALIRRGALERVGGYDPAFAVAQDFDLWLRLSEIGQLANLEESLLRYRLHPASVGGQQRDRQLSAVKRALENYAARSGRSISAVSSPEARSAASQRIRWARWAWQAGEYATARKHAGLAVRARPWSVSAWVMLLRSQRRPHGPPPVVSGQERSV